MKETASYYEDLLKKYLRGDCSAVEAEELFNYLQHDKSNPLLRGSLQEQFELVLEEHNTVPVEVSNRVYKKLADVLQPAGERNRKKMLGRLAIAATALLALTGGTYWWMQRNPATAVVKMVKWSE